MTLTHIILAWLFVMAGYMLWNKFRDDRLTGKKFFDFGEYNFLVRAVTLLLLTWLGFSLIAPEPGFKDPDEQIHFARSTRQPWLVTDAAWIKIRSEPFNPDHHFLLVDAHFQQENSPSDPPDIRKHNLNGVRIFNYYTDLTERDDTRMNDIGNLFLAYYYIQREGRDETNAFFHIRQVKNGRLKYLNYVYGLTLFYGMNPHAAEPYFESEIALNGYKEGAWKELAWTHEFSGRFEKLKDLAYADESRASVPDYLRYKVYFLEGDLFSYYGLRFNQLFTTLPLWGLLGDVLILLTWLLFLRKLSFLSPIRWRHFFLAIGIGALLAMSSWLLYEFYHHVLGFGINGEIVNDLLFCFLGIGFIEELVKLIPFLLILRFTGIIKKPIDYLLVASAAGLGFAFFENLLYISQYGLEVIHARALTSSVSHMVSGGIVAYGFVLAKFRWPGRHWLIPAFFLIAVFAHGFYDFWLMNEKVHSLAIVTLFFFLSEILVYVSFLNNALNQSTGNLQPRDLSFNTQRLASFIAGALVLVFLIEYVGGCMIYGTVIGNQTLLQSFISGGYLIFFLSVRLSNIDIVPGQWAKIEFFTGLLPSELLGKSRKKNYNSVVGLRLRLQHDPSTGALSFQLPITGLVKRRLTIQGDSGWFEFIPDQPLAIGVTAYDVLYFRSKEEDELVQPNEPVTVGLFVRVADFDDPQRSKLVFLDWVMAG
ncbi:MAG TPA: PrsW family glutamic-type intramembrane protease [Bacteroidia bacterium]|nr:PrsW family glutamic-type intramembrane protease [Bacteroidia bacterium]